MSTAIQWAQNPDGSKGEVWNPVTGCDKVSQGCKNCYAEGVANRFWAKQYPDVDGRPRRFTDVQCHEDRLEKPLHWRKPRRCFVNSVSDLFHPDLPWAFIDKVFAVMALAPAHQFIVLTKRPERMRDYLGGHGRPEAIRRAVREIAAMVHAVPVPYWPPPNVILGVSVEDQATADERIPLLLATPAAVRMVSVEPQLGPINLCAVAGGPDNEFCRGGFCDGDCRPVHPGIHWVVQGGESGPKARPFDIQWARDIRDQCKAAGVPYFLKQLGARVLSDHNPIILRRWLLEGGGEWTPPIIGPRAHERPLNAIGYVPSKSHGGDEAEWPADLQGCRAFPEVMRR